MEANILEHILDGREKPKNLPFSLLRNITEHFFEDRVIGHGGFATVYEGVLPNTRVAVKRIRNSHSIDEKLFYHEVDSLLMINHQNVVHFLGFCACTEQIAIKVEGSRQHIYAEMRKRLLCFEYMSNGSLQKHITNELRGLEWNTRFQIVKSICEGLHHLHKEKHIFHMDLKPANILLDSHMMPKITDFGLSRLDEKSQTMTEHRCLTLGYCAPEYLLSGKMSFKSDMFSLGVIIIELVTGDKGIPDNKKSNVLRRWRHRWKKSGKKTPLIYQQVAKCIEIGLLCQKIDPSKRPFIWEMIHDIREIEGVSGEISNTSECISGLISPYSEDDMLGVEPLILHFPFELNKQISCSLQLTNQTDAYITFNILNMSPLPYYTQPNKDIVPPRSKFSVDIALQAQGKAPRDMRHADEFTVWSTKVNDGLLADDITTNMFSKESGVVDAVKLDVVFDAEGSTKANDGLAAEDITSNMFKKETCMVDKIFCAHSDEVWFLQFSNNGKYLASASTDKSVIIWKVDEGGKLLQKHILTGHARPVMMVAWSPDDCQLLTRGLEEAIRRWDVESGECIHVYEKPGLGLVSCGWFPDGKQIFSVLTDQSFCLWDLNGKQADCWKGQRLAKTSDCAVAKDGKLIITVNGDSTILLFNRDMKQERLIEEDNTITSFSLSEDGDFLLVNILNAQINLWNIRNDPIQVKQYTGHKRNKFVIRSCFGGSEQAFIASGSEDSKVYIWHRASGDVIGILSGHSGSVNCVSWNPTNPHMLASASDDHTIRIWTVRIHVQLVVY